MKQTLSISLMLGLFLMTQTVNAQFSAGGGLAFGLESEDLGLQLRGLYQINEKIRGDVNLTFYFDGVEDVNVTEINLNGHYLIHDGDSFSVYGLGGLNIFRVGVSFDGFSSSSSEIGLNLGGGITFPFSDTLSGIGEIKYAISDADQLVIGAGVLYNF